MPLTFLERKRRMPIGAQLRVATRCEVPESYVSHTMRDEVHPKSEAARAKLRGVQEALAEELGLPVEAVFRPVEAPAKEEAAPVARAS